MPDALESYEGVRLELLLLATQVLLDVDPNDRPDPLEVELVLFRERIERVLLLESGESCVDPAARVTR